MRPHSFLLTSLLALACAPHVARADTPCAGDDDEDEWSHVHEHSSDSSHSAPWRTAQVTTLDEVHDAKPTGLIDVHAFAGTVHVTGTTQNQLKVHANVSGDCRIDIAPSGDRTSVRLQCAHGPGRGDLDIQVPQANAVEVRTLSANITVQGVTGSLQLQSVTADIEVKGGAPAAIEAHTTNGNVHIDAPTAEVHAQSVSGDVHVAGAHGKASIHTVSGDCSLSGGDFSDVRYETVSGDVTFTGGITGNFEVQSHSGDVTIHVPATTNADVELRSFSGDLEVDVGNGAKKSEHELDAKLGVGGARVRVRTFSGDVKLTR